MTGAQPLQTIHATSVAIDGHGILIMGPSGSGKSDLALRLIDRGARLISDDYTSVSPRDVGVILSAPANIAERMEIRHLGIIDMREIDADLMAPAGTILARLAVQLEDRPERMPQPDAMMTIAGCKLPLIVLAGLEASAPIKVEWALRLLLRNDGA